MASVTIPAIGRSNILLKLSATLLMAMCLTAAVLIALPADGNPWLPVAPLAAIFCGGFAALSLLTAKLRTLQRTLPRMDAL